MTGSSPSEFRPAEQVVLCKSLDGRVLKKGDIVYTLNDTELKTFAVDLLLGDSRIKISLLNPPANQTINETLPSHKVVYNILEYIKTRLASLKYQLEIELPNKQNRLLEIAKKLNPTYQMDIDVGDNTQDAEI